ncbi:MAG: SDR family NAD(P)-dependent oxidoreductase [Deltaproteobacteria bacterium]|nr:SDR family NAD(P)-dependent oxidoreductase [Deltaproteobacteria bacterium]
MKLENKICIITGAASGIGRASALLFARVGGTVVVADVNEAGGKTTVTDIESEGGKASFIRTDVSRADEVESLVEQTVSEHGRVDVLFNNAGIDYMGPLHGMKEDDWDRVIDINLKGTFLGVKYAIPHMRRQKGGTILSTASVAGLVGSSGLGAYNAAKGGVVLLTKHLAVEYGRFGIRANCLCPGVIETPMTHALRESEGAEAIRDAMLALYPLKRFGKPEEVAWPALFLVSDASSFITGHALTVDGGMTAGAQSVVDMFNLRERR